MKMVFTMDMKKRRVRDMAAKKYKYQLLMKAVSDLINSSADDLSSSLRCSKVNGNLDATVLQKALEICTRRCEKTKVKILNVYIKKMAKGKGA